MAIPPERALVCAHPTLVELPVTTFRDLPHPGIGCPACHWRAAIPHPLSYLRYLDAYVAACIGLTFGPEWADRIFLSRLLHRNGLA